MAPRLPPALMLPLLACSSLAVFGCAGSDSTSPDDAVPASPEFLTANTLSFQQLSGGEAHTCGIAVGGKLYCWGQDYGTGRLGNGSAEDQVRPTAVAGGLSFRWVSAGLVHTCGVATDYRAYCWGSNDWGQLGDGTTTRRLTPKLVSGGLLFRQVSASNDSHSCGLTTNNKVYCWGYNGQGQLGTGEYGDNGEQFAPVTTPRPLASTATFRQVATGAGRSCAVTQAFKAFCWGEGTQGKLGGGPGSRISTPRPQAVAGGLAFHEVTVGVAHTCGTTTNSQVYCWGWGAYGQLGNGYSSERWKPRLVVGGLAFDRVTAGALHTCGETTGNKAYCWGYNLAGQVGDGSTVNRFRPVAVKGGHFFSQVTAGGHHTCGVVSGKGFCWGYNSFGQLGDGTKTTRLVPVPVTGAM